MGLSESAARYEPDDVYLIDTHEKLRVLANPLRMQILDSLTDRARTAKEIGDLINVQSNTRYYHLSELEKAGMVRVVETVISSGIQQKYYRATARYFRMDLSLLHGHTRAVPEHGVAFIVSAIDRTARELQQSIEGGVTEDSLELMRVSRRSVTTTREKAAAFKAQLSELDDNFRALNQDDGDVTMVLGFALFPHEEAPVATINAPGQRRSKAVKPKGGGAPD